MNINLTPLHSRCGTRQREEIVNLFNDGSLRGIAAEMDPKMFGRSYSILYNRTEYPLEIVDLRLKNIGTPLNEEEALIIQATINTQPCQLK